ncbi:MAG: winged helix-turn-helix transcriptional regulator [Candidatus Aenigmarchaeota archaeon]|nr:winged helix-turn-helix transcriptional regulator [Candidatus Aenigmarchaeota archaeon]
MKLPSYVFGIFFGTTINFIYIDKYQYVNMRKLLKIFKGLSDETRLKIVEFLLDGEKCVCEIVPFTKRTQSTVSVQLSKLEYLGIIESRREGRKIYYKLTNEKVREILRILNKGTNQDKDNQKI